MPVVAETAARRLVAFFAGLNSNLGQIVIRAYARRGLRIDVRRDSLGHLTFGRARHRMFGAVARLALEVAAPGKPDILVILARRPIKPFYVRKFVAMCDESET